MKAILEKEEINVLHKMAKKVFFQSHYAFLTNHNSYRPRAIHTFMGESHGGKSTLVRSLVLDVCLNDPPTPILVWLSEETVYEFLAELYRCNIDKNKLKHLHVYSELDYKKGFQSVNEVFIEIKRICFEHDIELIFIDNLTTSFIYMDRQVKEQSIVSKELKKLANDTDCPIALMVHTGAAVNNGMSRLIEMNDIRGSKTIVNLSNFFYIMQSFHDENKITSTIRITKHRGQEVAHKFYKLNYSSQARLYAVDEMLTFEEFKEIFKKRNLL